MLHAQHRRFGKFHYSRPVWKCINYPAPGRGDRVLFLSDFFLSLFVSLSTTLRENGWTDLHEIFREGVEWPWDDLIKFRVNSGKRIGGSKVNLLSPAIAIWFDCGLLAVLCCHLATENVMKLLFLAFGYVAAGARGLLCRAPQLVLNLFKQLLNTAQYYTSNSHKLLAVGFPFCFKWLG